MAIFRILHASDPHMGAVPYEPGIHARIQVSHDLAPLEAFVRFAHKCQPAIDAILVSGDLSTTGDHDDLMAAYKLYTAPAANANVSKTPAGEPTLVHWTNAGMLDVLPGNHDRFRSWKVGYRPGGRIFDQVFCPNQGTQLWCAGQGVAHGVKIRRRKSIVNVVKADFTLRRGDGGGKWFGWFGQGRVDQMVLDDLVDATNKARASHLKHGWTPVTLWAIHFDPFTTDEMLSLLESEKLAQAARKLEVAAILCGHTHESKLKPLSDKTMVYVCGTTAQAGPPSHWDCQIIKVETDETGGNPPTISVYWYRYDMDKDQFQFIGTR